MKPELNIKDKNVKQLLQVIASFERVSDARDFFLDLCTPSELKAMADRWEVAQLIEEGMDYRSISKETRCSTATITRVGRSLKYGQGGYQKALKKAQH